VSNYKFAGLTLACTAVCLAQDVISARSGLIHYTEGTVLLEGKQVTRKAAEFPSMKAGQELRTKQGRVEVLLTPSVILRMAENSSFRLGKNDLMDTKLEMLTGSAILEVGEVQKGQSLTMALASSSIDFDKKGLFRLDAEPARIRVYDGSAMVASGKDNLTLKEGKQATLGSAMVVPTKFDKEDRDTFYRWAQRRSGYLAVANIAAAKRAHDGSMSFTSGSWIYNPIFGMFTYLPMSGIYRNPFGFSYYSPMAVTRVYYRPPVTAYSPGMSQGMAHAGPSMRGTMDMGGSRGYSGGAAMSAPAPAASSGAAPAAGVRGGGGNGARGGR